MTSYAKSELDAFILRWLPNIKSIAAGLERDLSVTVESIEQNARLEESKYRAEQLRKSLESWG